MKTLSSIDPIAEPPVAKPLLNALVSLPGDVSGVEEMVFFAAVMNFELETAIKPAKKIFGQKPFAKVTAQGRRTSYRL